MSEKKLNKNITIPGDHPSDEDGGSGTGSQIQFADFITGRSGLREDQLPPDELRRILAVHDDAHEARVKKQKELRDQRKDLKEGKMTLDEYRQSQKNSQYPPHPLLSEKAQFSGMDKQNNPVPTDSQTQTNEGDKNELENQYRLRNAPEMGKKFNPRPQFPG